MAVVDVEELAKKQGLTKFSERELEEVFGGAKDPNWKPANTYKFTENRPPIDSETILKDKSYIPTNKTFQGAKIYTKDGKFYHRDNFHRGVASHLEVYNKQGTHLGEADIETGKIIPGTADPNKKLKL